MGFAPAGKQFCIASLCLTVFAAASVASAQILPLNPSRYRITPAPEFSTGWAGSARAFVWVDNERLLFLANDRQLSRTEQREGRQVVAKGVPTIHLWDFGAGTIVRYRDEPLAHYLCAIDGRVYYGLYRDDKKVIFDGVFGQESELSAPDMRVDSSGRPLPRGFNRLACQEYWYADLPRPHSGRPLLLRAEHGIIERTGTAPLGASVVTPSQGFKWWHHTTGKSAEIPFPQEWIVGPIVYSELMRGYLFWREVNRLERGAINRFYLWKPIDNTVRTLDVLGSENWTALYSPRLTKAGLVVKSSAVKKNRRGDYDLGPQGVYLFGGGPVQEFVRGPESMRDYDPSTEVRPLRVEQIVRGLINEMSDVSPDGCKIAVVVDPWDAERRRIRLEALDFCTTGK